MRLYQDVFFRLADLARGRRTIAKLNFLRRSQHWDQDRLLAWQLDRLNAVLAQAKSNSPFYKERLGDVQLPLQRVEDIARLPVLTKDDIRDNLDAIKAVNVPETRFMVRDTGGSTGEPMPFFWDRSARDWNRASVYRSAEWAGIHLGERAVQMSGSHFDFSRMQSRGARIRSLLHRYKELPVAAVNDALFDKYWEEIVAYRPTSIWGYSSALDMLAARLQATGEAADTGFLNAVLTSSETLRPEQRERINTVLGPDVVFDQYGSSEFYVAAECASHNGYHVHSEVLLVEVVGPNDEPVAPGEMGRVLITDLTNLAFPFVRYEIGDLAVPSDGAACPCGVQLPRLERIEGRISDVVVLSDRVLTAPNFTVFFHLPGIKAFQIRQESVDSLKVHVVPDRQYTPHLAEYVMGGIRDLIGEAAQVELIEQDHIDVPPSGKRRFVISDVAPLYY